MPIIAKSVVPIKEYVKHLLVRWCRYSEKEIYFMKAETRLNVELDVKQVIRSINFLKAAVKLISSKRERRLLRIQANRTIIAVTKSDIDYFNKKQPDNANLLELQQIHADSSAFDSEMQTAYLQKLNDKMVTAEGASKFNTNERRILRRILKDN